MAMISNGAGPAGKRIVEAGVAYQRSKGVLTKGERLVNDARLGRVHAALYGTVGDVLSDIKEYTAPPRQLPLLDRIGCVIRDACETFGVKKTEILSHRRQAHISIARHYVAQRLIDETSMSYPAVGRVLGGRDHTTIINSCRDQQRQRVAEWLAGKGAT